MSPTRYRGALAGALLVLPLSASALIIAPPPSTTGGPAPPDCS